MSEHDNGVHDAIPELGDGDAGADAGMDPGAAVAVALAVPLDTGDVVELQAFNEKKAWIIEKTKYLESLPALEQLMVDNTAFPQPTPGLPGHDEVRRWKKELRALEEETDQFDEVDMKRLRRNTKAALDRHLTPEDTDLVELTLQTLKALDYLRLELIQNRAEQLELLGHRLRWEEQRLVAEEDRLGILGDLDAFITRSACWSPGAYDEAAVSGPVSTSARDVAGSGSPVPSSTSARSTPTPGAGVVPTSSSQRFLLWQQLSADASKLSRRIIKLQQGTVAAAAMALDRIISVRPMPDQFLDEQDRLENETESMAKLLAPFAHELVAQWKKADELYGELVKHQNEGQSVLAELEKAATRHPNHRMDSSFRLRLSDLVSKLSKINEAVISSQVPRPTHTAYPDQAHLTEEIIHQLMAERTIANNFARLAAAKAKEYHESLQVVRRAEELKEQLVSRRDQLSELGIRLVRGTDTLDGSGAAPDLSTESCLDTDRHSAYMASLPILLKEVDDAIPPADKVIRNSRAHLVMLKRVPLDKGFLEEYVEAITSLESERSSCGAARRSAPVVAERFEAVRLAWSTGQEVQQACRSHHADILEGLERDRWKTKASIQPGGTPPTPETPSNRSFADTTSPSDALGQLDIAAARVSESLDTPIKTISNYLGDGLRSRFTRTSEGIHQELANLRELAKLWERVRQQAAVMKEVTSEADALDNRLSSLILEVENLWQEALGAATIPDLAEREEPLRLRSSELRDDINAFSNRLAARIPFVAGHATSGLSPYRVSSPKSTSTMAMPQTPPEASIDLSVSVPFDPVDLDRDVREQVNVRSINLTSSLHNLNKRLDLLALAKRVGELEQLLTLAETTTHGIAETLNARTSAIAALASRKDAPSIPDVQLALASLDTETTALIDFSNNLDQLLSNAISPAQHALQSIDESIASGDADVYEALLSQRQDRLEDLEDRDNEIREDTAQALRQLHDVSSSLAGRLAALEAEEAERVAAEKRKEEERVRMEAEERKRERVRAQLEEETRRQAEIQQQREMAERLEAERLEAERLEAERLEAERLEAERLEAERLEAERLEAERMEAERLEAERLEAERLEAERLEAERLEAERLEAERLEAERLEAKRLAAERLEVERLESERLEAERLEVQRLEAERLEAEQLEAQRLEAERLEAERLEAERLEAERLEAERLEAEHLEAEHLDAERLGVEGLEAERLEAEHLQSERERLEAERLKAERLEAPQPAEAIETLELLENQQSPSAIQGMPESLPAAAASAVAYPEERHALIHSSPAQKIEDGSAHLDSKHILDSNDASTTTGIDTSEPPAQEIASPTAFSPSSVPSVIVTADPASCFDLGSDDHAAEELRANEIAKPSRTPETVASDQTLPDTSRRETSDVGVASTNVSARQESLVSDLSSVAVNSGDLSDSELADAQAAEDVFGRYEPLGPKAPRDQYAEVHRLLAELRAALLEVNAAGLAFPLPSDAHLGLLPIQDDVDRVYRKLLDIQEQASQVQLSDSDKTGILNRDELQRDLDAALGLLPRLQLLSNFGSKAEECEAAISEVISRLDAYPHLPKSSGRRSPISVEVVRTQLGDLVERVSSLVTAFQAQAESLTDDDRVASERARIEQMWGEAQDEARDRLDPSYVRSKSVLSMSSLASSASYPGLLKPFATKPSLSRQSSTTMLSGRSSVLSASTNSTPFGPSNGLPKSTSRSVSGPTPRTPGSRLPRYAQSPTPSSIFRERTSSSASSYSQRPRQSYDGVPPVWARGTSGGRSRKSSIGSETTPTRPRNVSLGSSWSRTPRQSFGTPMLTPREQPRKRKYVANPKNKLDVAVGDVINRLPVNVTIEAVPGWKDQSGKYWIGESVPKLCFCRILRSQTVMVRVGGGWMELSKFIKSHYADLFRLLPPGPLTPPMQREEPWISSATLLKAAGSPSRAAGSPLASPIAMSPSFADIATASPPPHAGDMSIASLSSITSSPGSPLASMQFMRRADDSARSGQSSSSTRGAKPRGKATGKTATRAPIWRP